jgi:hypothetical protein
MVCGNDDSANTNTSQIYTPGGSRDHFSPGEHNRAGQIPETTLEAAMTTKNAQTMRIFHGIFTELEEAGGELRTLRDEASRGRWEAEEWELLGRLHRRASAAPCRYRSRGEFP